MKYIKKISPFHIDSRGKMFNLLTVDAKITSVLLITCKKGAIRANHYHKKDAHYSYMLKGKMEYTYRNLKLSSQKKTVVVGRNEIIHTPPMTVHAMKFIEDSEFIALTTESRGQKDYEGDTVRIDLIKDKTGK